MSGLLMDKHTYALESYKAAVALHASHGDVIRPERVAADQPLDAGCGVRLCGQTG